MVFYAAAAFLVVTGAMLVVRWDTPNANELLLLLSLGVLTLFAQYTIVSAYQFAAVYVLAPFEYVVIVWAVMLGWLIFGEIPTVTMLFGSSIVVLCGLTIVHLERRARRDV